MKKKKSNLWGHFKVGILKACDGEGVWEEEGDDIEGGGIQWFISKQNVNIHVQLCNLNQELSNPAQFHHNTLIMHPY